MKPFAKKLSAIMISLAMAASLTPFPGGLLLADETEAETPAIVSETEPEKKKEQEKPAEKTKETEKPTAPATEETEKKEDGSSKETEKPETAASKETEPAETEVPKETEKEETEAPAETEKPETDIPQETEAPAETDVPAESEKQAADTPDETETPDAETPDTPDEKAPEESDANPAKDAPIVPAPINNVNFADGILTWDAVSGATQYEIKVSSFSFTVSTNSFNLGKEIDRLITMNEIYPDPYFYIYLTAYDKNGIYKADKSLSIHYQSTAKFEMGTVTGAVVKNGVLTWNAFKDAKYYGVEIGYYETDANNRSINLDKQIDELIERDWIEKAGNGKYPIHIYAYTENWNTIATYSFDYEYESKTTPIVYGTLKNVSLTNGMLTWDPYEGATSYYLELSSAWGKLTETSSFNIGKAIDDLLASGSLTKSGKYRIAIVAYNSKNMEIAGWDGPLAYDSSVDFTTGKITNAVVTNGILKWDAYKGATSYSIEISDGSNYDWVTVRTNSVDLRKQIDIMIKNWFLDKSADDNYQVTITAENNSGYSIAECSLTFNYKSTAEPLSTGNITGVTFDDTTGKMSWDAYSGAAKYDIYVSDVRSETTATTYAVNSRINSLISSGVIEKSSPYQIYIYAYDKDGVLIAEWWGNYHYKSSAKPGVIGTVSNIKTTNGIMSWNKYKGAVKYKIFLPYQNITITTTASNAIYLQDLINKQIALGNMYWNNRHYIRIEALNKSGVVIGQGETDYMSLEANPLSIKGKNATAKARRKTKKLSVSKVITFINRGQGKLAYTKLSGNKKISINKTTGKVTVKKGLKKKTYKVTFKVSAAGRSIYAGTFRSVTIKIKVK